jgi:hypothetical protein
MIALPVFGYKSHISIERRFGFIREMGAPDTAAAEEVRHFRSSSATLAFRCRP